MYCSACATPIEAGQTVCPTCGQHLSAVPVTPAAAAPPPPPPPPPLPMALAATRRPGSIVAATWLLATCVVVSFAATVNTWINVGPVRMASLYTTWIGLSILALWTVTVVLTFSGKAVGRILVLVGLAWTAFNMFSNLAAFIGAGRMSLMGRLYWMILALRLVAAFLLFRKESTAWFQTHSGVQATAAPA